MLHYPRIQNLYAVTDEQIGRYLALLVSVAELVDLGPPIELPLVDRDDWAVLRTAMVGSVDIVCSNDGGFHSERVIAFCAQYDIRTMRSADLLRYLKQQ